MNVFSEIINKEAPIAVVGLGYVGLPIALEFARSVKVIGFDINVERVNMMRNRIDPSQELAAEEFDHADIHFTCDLEDLRAARVYIVAVPTPIDDAKQPDLKPLISATTTVGQVLKKGDYVIYESTVYPGCTEEDCVPVLEDLSSLKMGVDFKVGYSPERINPGDKEHTLKNIIKVVSGNDAEALETVAQLYEIVVQAGVFRASSLKVAEAAKIIENTQRDVNIALMNELSIIFGKMGINTYEVLEAAGTKWNFLKFSPGLVGGHCIGVDPYYLTHKSAQLGYHARIINAGRDINDGMGAHAARQIIKQLIAKGFDIKGARVLVLGTTFKENVSDIRNSKVADLIYELQSYGIAVDVADPHADSDEVKHEYGYGLVQNPKGPYSAVFVAVSHRSFVEMTEADFAELLANGGILADLKGLFRNRFRTFEYWSL
jgi:UDP-N-acetyl-D-galactosamine dehydrogenase